MNLPIMRGVPRQYSGEDFHSWVERMISERATAHSEYHNSKVQYAWKGGEVISQFVSNKVLGHRPMTRRNPSMYRATPRKRKTNLQWTVRIIWPDSSEAYRYFKTHAAAVRFQHEMDNQYLQTSLYRS